MKLNKTAAGTLAATFLLCSAPMTTGCAGFKGIKTSSNAVNSDLFNSLHDYEEKLAQVKVGMTRDEVFSALGVTSRSLAMVDDAEIQKVMIGTAQPVDTVANLKKFQEELASLQGFRLDYSEVDTRLKVNWKEHATEREGFQRGAFFIFKDDVLVKLRPIGAHVHDRDDTPHHKLLFKGVVFGADIML